MGHKILILRTLFLDVLLPILDKVLDGFLIYQYYTASKFLWMATTIGAIALPGTLEMVYWLLNIRHEPTLRVLFWTVCFGPILFPISTILW